MPRGGARPGAGRKPGSTTQRTREIAIKAAAAGITPLEVMLGAMRAAWKTAAPDGKVIDAKMAMEAAKLASEAAPYIHPRLSSIEQKIDSEVTQRVISGEPLTDAEWERRYSANGHANGSGLGATGRTPESLN